jgi:chaperonin GroEL (HSP60 family)
MVVNKL